jgi:hypothetical protein
MSCLNGNADSFRTATREMVGTASFNTSSCLVTRSATRRSSPVRLPPGRARLATRPRSTRLEDTATTMGMVVVACLVASAAGVECSQMTSGASWTNSAARAGSRSARSSPKR